MNVRTAAAPVVRRRRREGGPVRASKCVRGGGGEKVERTPAAASVLERGSGRRADRGITATIYLSFGATREIP